MREQIRIGTRESKLAITQAEIIKDLIWHRCIDMDVEIVTIKTTGDMILDQSLDKIGGKGLFVKELDIALREERIDLAVHSLKDVPAEIPAEFPLFAYTEREDPRDVLVYKPGTGSIPENGIIATSSRRREIQIAGLYPGCRFTGIRGNVQTRLRKLSEQTLDGTVLAAAGLRRLDMEAVIGRIFSVDEVVPAAGQGILALQGGKRVKELLRDALNQPRSEIAALAERQFIAELDGGCSSPVAAYARVRGQEVLLTGLYYNEETHTSHVDHRIGEVQWARHLGEELAKEMKQKYE